MVMEGGREWKRLADQEVSARIPPQFVITITEARHQGAGASPHLTTWDLGLTGPLHRGQGDSYPGCTTPV